MLSTAAAFMRFMRDLQDFCGFLAAKFAGLRAVGGCAGPAAVLDVLC
jgi:hypothetical protein